MDQYGWAEASEGYWLAWIALLCKFSELACWLLNERKGVGVPQDEREESAAPGVVCRPDPGRSGLLENVTTPT